MEPEYLGRQMEVSPVLIQLSEAQKLYGLAKDKSPGARSKLTSCISRILEMDVTTRESEMVADVLVDLLRQAEKDMRQSVAEQLSTLENVPLRLILQLANDEIEIATPILKRSEILSDLDLTYIIKAKSAQYWRVIATRKHLGDQVIDLLADTHDYETALSLVQNLDISLTEHAALTISDMAQTHEDLAVPLLRRKEISNAVITRLYEYVGQEIKNYILKNFKLDTNKIIESVDNIVQEFKDSLEPGEFVPAEYMIKAAQVFHQKGQLTPKLMLRTLRRGHFRSFVAQFSVFAELNIKTVGEILMQSHGQGLAIACKAYGIEKQDFVSIFLLTNQFRNSGRMVETDEMTKAITYYNRVEQHVALQIIKNSVKH